MMATNWTSAAPTKPGDYWWRLSPRHTPRVVRLENAFGELRATHCWSPAQKTAGEWGPRLELPADDPLEKPFDEMTEPEIGQVMTRAARAVQGVLGARSMFTLIVFDDAAVGQYVSTAQRSTMIAALKETVERLESLEDVPR
jgi:hypothetical protein